MRTISTCSHSSAARHDLWNEKGLVRIKTSWMLVVLKVLPGAELVLPWHSGL